MNCWSCQAENPATAKFCFNCGSRLVPDPATEAPCRSCGFPLPLDARFCGNCGTPDPVAPVAEVPAAVPPAAASEAEGDGDAAALAYDHEEEDEATILRSGLEEPPMIEPTPGIKSRDRLNTEPAKVAVARTLAERLGRASSDSPGAYSKQGPSLRKPDAKGKPPPPPAIGGAKPGKGAAPAPRKADTEQSLPRTAAPARQAAPPEAPAKASKLPPVPSIAARPARPGAGAQPAAAQPAAAAPPAAVASPAPPSASLTMPAPSRVTPGTMPSIPAVATPAAPSPAPAPVSTSATMPAPSRTAPGMIPATGPAPIAPSRPASTANPPRPARVPTSASLTGPAPRRPSSTNVPVVPEAAPPPAPAAPAEPSRSRPRTITEPQKAVFASATPSEVAEILAAPEGWPDITDELAEVRFSALQGVDDGVRAELETLRAKYPGHPEVETLAAELGVIDDALAFDDSLELPVGVPRRTRPPVEPEAVPAATSVDGPPPLGRFPITQPPSSPVASSSPSRPGVPRPAPLETSDELLDADGNGFDDLDDPDEADPDPGESMSDMTIVERVDLERLGVRDADELDGPGDDELADDLDEPDEPDFVDRTMMVPSLQPPAPFDATKPPASRPATERRATLAPGSDPLDERRSVTLAPGSDALDEERRHVTLSAGSGRILDEERRSTLPPGGLVAELDDPPTLSGLEDPAPSLVLDDLTPVPPSRATVVPTGGPVLLGGPSEASDGFMTAPDRDADTAAASGQFRVADLGLDDMPDLSSGFPPEPELDVDRYGAAPEPELELDVDLELTEEGTVITRAPLPPAPYGRGQATVPVLPVRLMMLGSRGEVVAERRIEPGSFLDVGRQAGEPWAEDRRMEPLHARLFPGPGGVVVDDFGLPSGVYTQIIDTIAVEDGDEFKVGQARLTLQRVTGRGWGQLTVVRHDSSAPLTLLLDRDEIIIGRDEGDLTLPNDTFVSGDHCRFLREGNAVYLEDLGSSNGTYIRVRAGQCVAFGGLVLIGHTQFRVLPG